LGLLLPRVLLWLLLRVAFWRAAWPGRFKECLFLVASRSFRFIPLELTESAIGIQLFVVGAGSIVMLQLAVELVASLVIAFGFGLAKFEDSHLQKLLLHLHDIEYLDRFLRRIVSHDSPQHRAATLGRMYDFPRAVLDGQKNIS
jgi:hypothetical protein